MKFQKGLKKGLSEKISQNCQKWFTNYSKGNFFKKLSKKVSKMFFPKIITKLEKIIVQNILKKFHIFFQNNFQKNLQKSFKFF